MAAFLFSASRPMRVIFAHGGDETAHRCRAGGGMSSEQATVGARLRMQAGAPADDGRATAPADLVDKLFGRVPAEDLAAYSPAALADLAAGALDHLRGPFERGLPDIR